jgi:hypothetical protein
MKVSADNVGWVEPWIPLLEGRVGGEERDHMKERGVVSRASGVSTKI